MNDTECSWIKLKNSNGYICPYCGTLQEAQSLFCKECGQKVMPYNYHKDDLKSIKEDGIIKNVTKEEEAIKKLKERGFDIYSLYEEIESNKSHDYRKPLPPTKLRALKDFDNFAVTGKLEFIEVNTCPTCGQLLHNIANNENNVYYCVNCGQAIEEDNAN